MAEAGEVERFFESLADSFDTTAPLRWSFLLDGLAGERVGPLMAEVGRLGFTEVEPLADEEQEKFDNLPEGLQNSEKGQAMEEAASALESAVSELESAVDSIDSAIGEIETAAS
jgi:hypothetical protein